MASLGERLKELRTEKGLSQKQLATICGVARSTISVYEINRSQPDDNIKKILASFFDVSIDYLCGYTDIKRTENLYYSPNELDLVKIPLLDLTNIKIESFNVHDTKNYIFVDKKSAVNGSYFFTKVTDDCMINARIATDDLIYVRIQSTLNNGDIGVIVIKDTVTLRRVISLDNSLILFPESSTKYSIYSYADIQSGLVKIIGKVVNVIFQV